MHPSPLFLFSLFLPADADYGDADNAAGPLEINRRTTRSSGEASAVPAGRPTVAVSAISDKNIRASFTSPSPLEPPTRHLTESKTAEKELTVVTMVPIVTRYRPANGASQEMVTPREDLGAALSVKVPASPLQASAYGGEKSVPALIRKEYFRANGERGSLSLSRSFSSSELDYDRAQQKETHSGDGRRVLGATLTLRQVRVYLEAGGLFLTDASFLERRDVPGEWHAACVRARIC